MKCFQNWNILNNGLDDIWNNINFLSARNLSHDVPKYKKSTIYSTCINGNI